jgi:hypothetical protein
VLLFFYQFISAKPSISGLAQRPGFSGPKQSEDCMLIHDDIFEWSGWGGRLSLGSGKCRLRIYDLKETGAKSPSYLFSTIVIVTDAPGSKMSVKSCTSHIATQVVKEFKLNPQRTLWVEYYPESKYGVDSEHVILEKFEAVEFTWHAESAIKPQWRELKPPLLDEIKKLIS